jgi:hypothetical protein
MPVSVQAFRDRYPAAQIISELLLVERDRFVVKVTITTPSSGAASGLAAHTEIEIAEDQARLRAMAALGYAVTDPAAAVSSLHPELANPISTSERTYEPPSLHQSIGAPSPSTAPFTSPPAAAASPPSPSPVALVAPVTNSTANGLAAKPKPASPKLTKVVATPPTVEKIRSQPEAIEPQQTSLDGDDFDETITPLDESVSAAEPQPEATVAPIPSEALPAPINLSDVIAQTDIELRRLGWSVETGREYLEQAYQKRSRHELSEEELIQFLCHLESL